MALRDKDKPTQIAPVEREARQGEQAAKTPTESQVRHSGSVVLRSLETAAKHAKSELERINIHVLDVGIDNFELLYSPEELSEIRELHSKLRDFADSYFGVPTLAFPASRK